MTSRQLKSLAKWMRDNGIIEFDAERGYIRYAESVIKQAAKKEEKTDPIPTTEDPLAKMPSDSDMINWSTPSFDVTIETRKDDEPVRVM